MGVYVCVIAHIQRHPILIFINAFGKQPWNDTTLGRSIITSGGFYAESYWYWIAVAALVGFILVFNLCYVLSLGLLDREYLNL